MERIFRWCAPGLWNRNVLLNFEHVVYLARLWLLFARILASAYALQSQAHCWVAERKEYWRGKRRTFRLIMPALTRRSLVE